VPIGDVISLHILVLISKIDHLNNLRAV